MSMKKTICTRIRNLAYFGLLPLLLGLASCSPKAMDPFYTEMGQALSLKAGMSKEQARQTLGVYPFDILHQQFDGCEVHHYLYQDRFRKLSDKKWSKNLVDGTPVKRNRNDLYLIFRDDQLETFFSGSGKDAKPLLDLKNDLMYVCGNPEFVEGPVYGCTDPSSLNYNPDATAEDNSCEYCPCDYVKNPWFDAKRKCGEPCISESAYRKQLKELGTNEDCDICEILQQGLGSSSGNVKIDLHLNGSDLQKTQPVQAVPEVKEAKPNIFQKMSGKKTSSIQPVGVSRTGLDRWGRSYDQNMALYRKRRRSGIGALISGASMSLVGIPLLSVGSSSSSGGLTATGATFIGAGVSVTLIGGMVLAVGKKYRRRANDLQPVLSLSPSIQRSQSYSSSQLLDNNSAGLTLCYDFC